MTFEFSKTTTVSGLNALVFSPYELRPGTYVTVSGSYVATTTATWDSGSDYSGNVPGTPYAKSVQCIWDIEDEVTIDGNNITINAINKGILTLTIYYKVAFSVVIQAVSAINTTSATYYNDWFYDYKGMAVPMTIVPMDTVPVSYTDYRPEDFTVTFPTQDRGVSILNGDLWTSNMYGTVKFIDHIDNFSLSNNLFRKGTTEVEVPLECQIEPVIRYSTTNGVKTGKIVEIDLQEWYNDITLDVRGILWHRDYLYALTNAGMYSFSRWSNLDIPDNSYTNIIGDDLAYMVDDKFLVTNQQNIKVYKVRHDYAHLNRDTDILTTREDDSEVEIS